VIAGGRKLAAGVRAQPLYLRNSIMFTRRKQLDRRRYYTREFLESLASKLTEAGFDRITTILPHNYPSVDPKNSEVPFTEFLERERNYAAVILKATSTSRNELMKILFINSNSRAVFADDTFPMAESEPSGLYFQSPDPACVFRSIRPVVPE